MARVLVTEYSGDLVAARDLAQRAAARSRATGSTYWLTGFLAQLGFVEVSAGNWAAALDALREVAEIFESTRMVDLEQLLWGVDYAEAAMQVGSLQEVELAISVLRRQGAAGRPEARAAARRIQALLQAARGEVEGALHELVTVVAERGSECPFESARSLLSLGEVHRRAGNKRTASETLNAAAEAFEDLAIPRWAEKARHQAARVGLHRTTSELTASERCVAELVGSGHTNQEVAAALFMSVKTVEANLTRIYRKLSVRSRTELANRVNRFDVKS
jgi:DNA-binding NarL/FixJ family response regulator